MRTLIRHSFRLTIRHFVIGLAVASACGAFGSQRAHAAPTAGNTFAVRDVTVFDGRQRLAGMTVLVREGRIEALGQGLAVPAGVSVVEGAGKTLLPGLIDSHTHTWGEAGRDALRFGVTTELDMFTDPRGLPAARRQRASMEPVAAADLWSSGVLATTPGGHGTEYGMKIPTITRPEEAAAFVAARVAEGSDYLKIVIEDGHAYDKHMPTLDRATVGALASAAKARGLLSVAHVATQEGAVMAFEAGVNGLAHVFIDKAADAAFLATARGRFVVPTLVVNESLSATGAGRKLVEDGRLGPWLSINQHGTLTSGFPPGWSKPVFIERALANTAALHKAGATILAGTDAGNPGTAHGASLHAELVLLVKAGLTPTQALAAATAEPARVFGLADRGRIAAGQRADLLLVEGDPTVDVNATRAIVTVWKNGHAVDRALRADEKPGQAAPAAPAATLIADFENDAPAFVPTTDQMAGGKSSAELVRANGALRVSGRIDGGLPYAWGGAMWAAGSNFSPVDYGSRKELVFKVRGEPRQAVAMLFSGDQAQARPAMLPFAIKPEWTEVRLPLANFAGGNPAKLRAIAFTAGLPAGDYRFEIDDVELR